MKSDFIDQLEGAGLEKVVRWCVRRMLRYHKPSQAASMLQKAMDLECKSYDTELVYMVHASVWRRKKYHFLSLAISGDRSKESVRMALKVLAVAKDDLSGKVLHIRNAL